LGDQQEEPHAQLEKWKQYSKILRTVNGKEAITIKFLSLSRVPLSMQLAYHLALCQTPFSKRKENKNTVLIANIVDFYARLTIMAMQVPLIKTLCKALQDTAAVAKTN